MILIGKTANCLLGAYVIAHSAVLKVGLLMINLNLIVNFWKIND